MVRTCCHGNAATRSWDGVRYRGTAASCHFREMLTSRFAGQPHRALRGSRLSAKQGCRDRITSPPQGQSKPALPAHLRYPRHAAQQRQGSEDTKLLVREQCSSVPFSGTGGTCFSQFLGGTANHTGVTLLFVSFLLQAIGRSFKETQSPSIRVKAIFFSSDCYTLKRKLQNDFYLGFECWQGLQEEKRKLYDTQELHLHSTTPFHAMLSEISSYPVSCILQNKLKQHAEAISNVNVRLQLLETLNEKESKNHIYFTWTVTQKTLETAQCISILSVCYTLQNQSQSFSASERNICKLKQETSSIILVLLKRNEWHSARIVEDILLHARSSVQEKRLPQAKLKK